MKVTPWNPWDHIKTLEEAKDYVEAIYEEMDSELDAANDCIVSTIESYIEFIDIVQFNAKVCNLPEQYQRMLNTLCERRRNHWQPLLEEVKKAQKSAKKTA